MACPVLYSEPLPLPTPATGRYVDEEKACIGYNMTLDEWKKRWLDRSKIGCDVVFNRLLYPPTDLKRKFDPKGFEQVSNDFDYMFSQYYGPNPDKGRHKLVAPGQIGYDSFQEVLLDACTLPQFGIQGVCRKAAIKMCQQCTRTDIINSSSVLRVCGCEPPALDPIVYPDVKRECDPLCAQSLVSKWRDEKTGDVKTCNDTVCVIDEVSIKASQSTIGGIEFSQVCPQCSKTQQCKCIIDSNLANLSGTGIIDSVTLRQYCGANSICLSIDKVSQRVDVVPCESSINPPQARTYKSTIPLWAWIIAVIIFIVGIIVVIASIGIIKLDIESQADTSNV